MKQRSTLEVECIVCKRKDRPHRGHGLCRACYQKAYYHAKLKPKGIKYPKKPEENIVIPTESEGGQL